MGQMIFYGILAGLALFAIYMLVVTASIGTKRFKTSQYFMSSLSYSEDATSKINLLIDKFEANLITASVNSNYITFKDNDSIIGEIWIKGKYFTYGNLYSYGKNQSREWNTYKPNIKTFHRIINLENKLINLRDMKIDEPKAETKSKSSEDVVVLD